MATIQYSLSAWELLDYGIAMMTYTLSEYQSSWRIYHHAETSTEVVCSISLQESIAIGFRKGYRRQAVAEVAVDFRGRTHVLATFEKLQDEIDEALPSLGWELNSQRSKETMLLAGIARCRLAL